MITNNKFYLAYHSCTLRLLYASAYIHLHHRALCSLVSLWLHPHTSPTRHPPRVVVHPSSRVLSKPPTLISPFSPNSHSPDATVTYINVFFPIQRDASRFQLAGGIIPERAVGATRLLDDAHVPARPTLDVCITWSVASVWWKAETKGRELFQRFREEVIALGLL